MGSDRRLSSYKELLAQIPEKRRAASNSLLQLRKATAWHPKGSQKSRFTKKVLLLFHCLGVSNATGWFRTR
jgi:hypothetical protein